MAFRTWAALAAVLCVSGCDSATENEVTEVSSFCVETGADRLVITGTLATCLSSSCDKLLESECTVTPGGDGLMLEARGLIESKGGECTADCGSANFRCEYAPEADGDLTIVAGDLSLDYAYPGAEQSCAGDEF